MAINIKPRNNISKKAEKHKPFSWQEILNKEITLFGKSFSDKKKEQLYSSLHTLIDAGIDLSAVFQTIIDEQEKKEDQMIYKSIYASLVKGLSLSESFKNTKQFSEYEYYSIQIGEETGNLSEIFKEMQIYFHQKIEQKRKLIGALTYPIVVLMVAFLVVIFMLNVIVPMFVDVFKRFGGELPWLTQQVMNLSNFVNQYILFLVLLLIGIVLAYIKLQSKSWFRQKKDKLLLKIPLFGTLVHKIYLSRFCKTMSLLIKAEIPIVEALTLTSKMITFYPLEESVLKLKEGILKGKTLSEGMKEDALFTAKIKSLIKVGEEVNQLDIIFEKLASQYEKEVDYNIQLFNSILEPLLIIFLALVIGIILVAMYLPIFKLSSEIL
jgi:type IV pilus assembly protein PilC